MTYQTVELGTGFWAIEQQGVRCFLLEGEEYALLVDTGYGGELREVCAGLTDKPIRLVHTHSDRDHVGASDQFAPWYMHPAEFSTHQLKNGTPAGCLPIWEGEIIDLGTYRLEVVLIPGHTPGSIALLERDKRFIIGGDSIQDNPIYMFGPGRDLAAFAASMEKLQGLQDAFDTVYPSHGAGVGHRRAADPGPGDLCRRLAGAPSGARPSARRRTDLRQGAGQPAAAEGRTVSPYKQKRPWGDHGRFFMRKTERLARLRAAGHRGRRPAGRTPRRCRTAARRCRQPICRPVPA